MKGILIRGIMIKFNPYIFLVIIIYGFMGYLKEITMVFLVTFIHELAHALAAKYYNVEVSEIELLPFGGVVRLNNDITIKPWKEMIIALVGPASNVLLFFIGYFFWLIGFRNYYYLKVFMSLNLIIAIFNLLPIFPLDGGRVVRAALAEMMGVHKSTKLVIGLGKVLSIFMLFIGIYFTYRSLGNAYIILLSVYIYYQANKEKKMAIYIVLREILRRKEALKNQEIMNSKHLTVLNTTNLNKVFKSLSSGKYYYISIINHQGKLVGELTESQIIDGISRYGGNINLATYLKLIERKETWK